MNISQGKRIVREYTSEFETLLGRLTTRDEATWLNVYIWGLQPHLATAVALKYPTTIAQASGHAEATELALRASQRPNIGENAKKMVHDQRVRPMVEEMPKVVPENLLRDKVGVTLV